MKKQVHELKIGILGGGQLGRMLLQEAVNWDLQFSILDPNADAPCKNLVNDFTQGDWNDFETVYNFGKNKDIVTIEFEDVNVEALEKLEKEGVKIFPQPHILKIIKDKGLQKNFYQENSIPTAPFKLVKNKDEMKSSGMNVPYFQKIRKGGYDGYGVRKISTVEDLESAFDAPSMIEQQANLKKELSVIVARNEKGEVVSFPVVDMEFNPESNMVQYLFSPAEISINIEDKATEIARLVIEKLGMVGILAVELFYTKEEEIWVNEIAPRPHNSGHHTIEANITSQYEQHLRAILNLPLGDTSILKPSAMVNLLGEKGFEGSPIYENIEKTLEMSGVYVHLYGKSKTKPFRKMGHVTILNDTLDGAKKIASEVKNLLKVKSKI